MFDLAEALRYLVESEGSDLHLKVPSPPMIRQHGELVPIPGAERLTAEVMQQTLDSMLVNEPRKTEEFHSEHEVDLSYALPGVARFRVNAFKQRQAISMVFRAIPFVIKTSEELMLPEVVDTLADEERGVILLTGTTGSGKSTTLAAMINRINSTQAKHIVTIEDPSICSFDQALLGHVQSGRVDMDTAMRYATHPHDFKLLVSSDGQRSTSIDQVMATADAG